MGPAALITVSMSKRRFISATSSQIPCAQNRELIEIATDRDRERQEKERREDERAEIGLSKPDDPACQQQRADDRSGGAEKAPSLGGEEEDRKADRHQGDTKCRTACKGGFERDDPGCHRDRTKRHQHIYRQRSGVTLGKRLESVGLLRGELGLLYQPSDVENDPDGRPPREYTDRLCVSSSDRLRMRRNRSPDRQNTDARCGRGLLTFYGCGPHG